MVVSISALPSLLGTSVGITNSTIGLKISAIPAGIQKYKSITRKKKKKKHNYIVLSAKTKLNTTKVLIPKGLIINLYINRGKLVS